MALNLNCLESLSADSIYCTKINHVSIPVDYNDNLKTYFVEGISCPYIFASGGRYKGYICGQQVYENGLCFAHKNLYENYHHYIISAKQIMKHNNSS